MSQNMLSCREAIEQLWAYIDGELDEAGREKLRAHLDVCASCFPHYDFEQAFHEFLRRHGTDTMPPALRRRVFLSLLAEESGASS